MRNKLVIIPCGKKKIWDDGVTKGPVQAGDAYKGTMFKLGVQYAEACDADWIILSAKYGYIWPDQQIEAYDVTFKKKGSCPISDKELYSQVIYERNLLDYSEVIGLGGVEYRKAITDSFCTYNGSLTFPFVGLSMGHYMHELKEAINVEVYNAVYRSYQVQESEPLEINENGKITFLWRYWYIPTFDGAFDGWLEGPPPTKNDEIKAFNKVRAQRDVLLELGPKPGAWGQFHEVTLLIGKRLLIQMNGSCYEDPFPMEAFCVGIHLNRDQEGFLQCFMCLKDVNHLDTQKNGADGMYDGSHHLILNPEGISMLDLGMVSELSIIQNSILV